MNVKLEFPDIFKYLTSITWKERKKWQKQFYNQHLYYCGYVCKIQENYRDDITPYCGSIYLNEEDLDLFVIGESPYQYARDFWGTVDFYLAYKSNEN